MQQVTDWLKKLGMSEYAERALPRATSISTFSAN